MSASSDDKISNVVVGNEDDDDENEDDDDENDVASIRKNQRTKPRFGVVLRQFAKAKSKIRRIKSTKRVLLPPSSSSSSSENANSSTGGSGKNKMMMMNNRISDDDDNRGSVGCKLCFLRPKVLESLDGSSTTSDPNNPNFTHAMLRVLIETNDFYSKDCNPHLDY